MERDTEQVLKQILEDEMKNQGITQDDLDLVDLEIAFSPVIPMRGDSVYDVIESKGGNYYLVNHPLHTRQISPAELKVMRFRYLISRSNPNHECVK